MIASHLLLYFGLLASPASEAKTYTPEDAQVVLRAANEAAGREEYDLAVQGYERLLKDGYGGEDLAYNLGTIHVRAGHVGKAILWLERALREDPSDDNARENLDRALKLRLDKLVGAVEKDGAEGSLAARVVDRTRVNLWTGLFLAFYLGCAALLIARRFASEKARLALGVVALACGIGALPTGAVTVAHAYVRERAHEAVVLSPTLPVREGPEESLKILFEVHEGLKVRLLDREGGFRHIRLPNGLEGWAPADGVEAL